MAKKEKELPAEDAETEDETHIPHLFSLSDEEKGELDDAVPMVHAPDGDYQLRLVDFMLKKNKVMRLNEKGTYFVMPVYEVIDDANADKYKNFSHFLELPVPGMDKKKRNEVNYKLKIWCKAHGVDYHEEIDWLSAKGCIVEALLSSSTSPGFGTQNNIDEFLGA